MSLRSTITRIAADLDVGHPVRKKLLAALTRSAGGLKRQLQPIVEKMVRGQYGREIQKRVTHHQRLEAEIGDDWTDTGRAPSFWDVWDGPEVQGLIAEHGEDAVGDLMNDLLFWELKEQRIVGPRARTAGTVPSDPGGRLDPAAAKLSFGTPLVLTDSNVRFAQPGLLEDHRIRRNTRLTVVGTENYGPNMEDRLIVRQRQTDWIVGTPDPLRYLTVV